MQRVKNFLTWLWKTFWGFPVWVKIALTFFIAMKINPSAAVSLLMIGVCLWAIRHMFRGLVPKKGKKK